MTFKSFYCATRLTRNFCLVKTEYLGGHLLESLESVWSLNPRRHFKISFWKLLTRSHRRWSFKINSSIASTHSKPAKNIPPNPTLHMWTSPKGEQIQSITFIRGKEEKCFLLVAMIYHAQLLGCVMKIFPALLIANCVVDKTWLKMRNYDVFKSKRFFSLGKIEFLSTAGKTQILRLCQHQKVFNNEQTLWDEALKPFISVGNISKVSLKYTRSFVIKWGWIVSVTSSHFCLLLQR